MHIYPPCFKYTLFCGLFDLSGLSGPARLSNASFACSTLANTALAFPEGIVDDDTACCTACIATGTTWAADMKSCRRVSSLHDWGMRWMSRVALFSSLPLRWIGGWKPFTFTNSARLIATWASWTESWMGDRLALSMTLATSRSPGEALGSWSRRYRYEVSIISLYHTHQDNYSSILGSITPHLWSNFIAFRSWWSACPTRMVRSEHIFNRAACAWRRVKVTFLRDSAVMPWMWSHILLIGILGVTSVSIRTCMRKAKQRTVLWIRRNEVHMDRYLFGNAIHDAQAY